MIFPFGTNQPAVAPRARAPELSPRTERAPRSEAPTDAPDSTERATRENAPPDFSALLALLGAPHVNAPQRPVALPDIDVAMAEGEVMHATVEEHSADADSAELPPGTQSAPARALGETRERELASTLRAEALSAARATILRLADERRETLTAMGGISDHNESGFPSSEQRDLLALSPRASAMGRGELLARGDQRGADVRAAIDALLDVAGTPRGHQLAGSINPAHSSAFASAVALSAADTATPVRDMEALAPEFRTRLDRIVERMRDEFGHDVQIIETVRSAERQEHLYAQGRTTPGPVVTWTTNSAHLTGEAADVIIDGKWNHPQAYARLHMIAAEEGVDTLGMRDPGHLELRGSAGSDVVRDVMRAQASRADNVMQAGGVAQVASVARVASVASVAQVAHIARVARAGAGAAGAAPAEPGSEQANGGSRIGDTNVIAARTANVQSNGRGQSNAGGTLDQNGREERRESARGAVAIAPDAVGPLSTSAERVLDGGVPRVVAPVGSTAAARAEAIAALREDAPARPVSSLTMQVDTPDGAEEIRVNLRGGAVGAQISTSNPMLADRLRMQTADLQDALGRHGLDTEPLRVQQTMRSQEGDAVRSALADRAELLRATATGQGQHAGNDTGARERPAARHQSERQSREDSEGTHQQGRRNSRQENN